MKSSLIIALCALLSACSSTPYSTSGAPYFTSPVKRGRLTQKFKNRSRRHDGIDIAGRKNSPIYAAESGRVLYAGREFSGYGKLIIVEHRGDTWASFYGHLNRIKVSEGDYVRKGEMIGLMGRTGRATGVHLHFEIRHNLRPVDPLRFIKDDHFVTQR